MGNYLVNKICRIILIYGAFYLFQFKYIFVEINIKYSFKF